MWGMGSHTPPHLAKSRKEPKKNFGEPRAQPESQDWNKNPLCQIWQKKTSLYSYNTEFNYAKCQCNCDCNEITQLPPMPEATLCHAISLSRQRRSTFFPPKSLTESPYFPLLASRFRWFPLAYHAVWWFKGPSAPCYKWGNPSAQSMEVSKDIAEALEIYLGKQEDFVWSGLEG